MTETATIIQAICYLLSKIRAADKIKLIKLIYLADKYHLMRYGRTLTNDVYFAMPNGPVGSTVKDVLSFNDICLSMEELEYLNELFEVKGNTFELKKNSGPSEYEMLSDTDREALDFVIEHFGNMTQWELRDYTHQYPEWYKHEEMFKTKRTKRAAINIAELLSTIEDDLLAMPKDHLEESERTLTGTFS